MTTNMAEDMNLAARSTPYDNAERTWLEFRFKLENYLTLVNERYVQLLQDADSQPVTKFPAGTDEGSVLIRTLSHTLYALLATLTTGRSLKLVSEYRTEMGSKSGDSWWRKTHRRLRVEDSQCCTLCCSREWVNDRQSSRKPGMRGNNRWTSTRNWRRQSWMIL